MNKVILVGRAVADPELKATPQGMHVANLRIVTNSYLGKDEAGNRKEAAEFHHLVLFGRQAEVVADYVRKGRQLLVEGRIQTRSWETEGQKRWRTEIVVDQFELLGSKPAEEEAA